MLPPVETADVAPPPTGVGPPTLTPGDRSESELLSMWAVRLAASECGSVCLQVSVCNTNVQHGSRDVHVAEICPPQAWRKEHAKVYLSEAEANQRWENFRSAVALMDTMYHLRLCQFDMGACLSRPRLFSETRPTTSTT
jgi:hypothetical protein